MKWQTVFVIASIITLMMAFRAYGAVVRVPGVIVGDWADYVATYEGNATTFGPSDNMTSATFTVLGISGTNVTLQADGHYANGSRIIDTGWIDVDTGDSGGTFNASGTLIAANLNQGDAIYSNATYFGGGTINETITRTYVGSPVTVNHFSVNMSLVFPPYANMNMTMDWYWYKATGITAEMHMTYNGIEYPSGNYTWMDWHLTVSSIIPEFPTLTVVPLFMIAALIAVAAYKTRILTRREKLG